VIPSFTERAKQWSSPPVDDIGYLPSADLLAMEDEPLLDLVFEMETNRYHGWRNFENRWRRVLRIDETTKKNVLDYGCGVGIEALQYARNGNNVSVADIVETNVELASRVIYLSGYTTVHEMVINGKEPFLPYLHPDTHKQDSFHVIHCAGVLHHIPKPIPVVRSMHEWLKPEGELRLMLYSDEAWKIATKTEPPGGDVYDYVEFDRFWQHWDAVGGYADYYTRQRLAERFGQWFHIETCQPLTEHGEYIGAVLRKR
jgi:SAM-dependent methyltransferase